MTRKCVLCKETNYKNTCSFFSAPKDQETRRKWQVAIGIENYSVSNDTYICSKHFRRTDIVTHWVSGVPPHVVTIKYKKCRLKPGAVPDRTLDAKSSLMSIKVSQCEKLEIDKDIVLPFEEEEATISEDTEEIFLIPRNNERLNNSNEEINILSEDRNYQDNFEDTGYNYDNACRKQTELSKPRVSKDSLERSAELMLLKNSKIQEIEFVTENFEHENEIMYDDDHENSKVLFVKDLNYEDTEQLHDITKHDKIIEQTSFSSVSDTIAAFFSKKSNSLCEDDALVAMCNTRNDNDDACVRHQSLKNKLNTIEEHNIDSEILYTIEHSPIEIQNQIEHEMGVQKNVMLFEDLLEIYTEVVLPQGWSFMVISKGLATTVMYLYMTSKNGIPIVEKQVFIKNDMLIRCATMGREIDPFLYNLVHEGRDLKVQSLSNIEELIEEFDQRTVCEGSSGLEDVEEINVRTAYREGVRWRHTACPIIVNNGSSRCSKCTALSNTLARCKRKRHNFKAADLDVLQRKIRVLQRALRMVKINQRFELSRNNFKDKFRLLLSDQRKMFMDTINSSNMPKIQKLMVKQCLKASVFESKRNVKCSQTWVFLCLLLYIESPRMYRYILLNNYMTLPSLHTVRRYLHQIKTDPQFYNLFQRTIKPFRPTEEEESEQELIRV